MNKKIGFLGAGNMAGAIINGITSSKSFLPKQIYVYDILPEKRECYAQRGFSVCDTARDLAEKCDVIVLAVKPQNFEALLKEIAPAVTQQKAFITIAAGISTSYIQTLLNCACPVVRAMPNTPLLLGQGATALCRTKEVTDTFFEMAKGIFASCGIVEELNERYLNAVISVNGSSPAYIYLFAKAAVDYAKTQGIDKETALRLFCQTLKGSADMLLKGEHTPEQLIKIVSSPGGTTLKAMEVFETRGFVKMVQDAMEACTNRAEELGK